MRSVCERRPGRSGLGEYPVDIFLVLDDLPDAELSRLGGAKRDVGVLCQFGARVESEYEAAVQLEHGDSAGCGIRAALKRGADDAGRVETEPIAVERERAVEVVHSERDYMDPRFHWLADYARREVSPNVVRSSAALA